MKQYTIICATRGSNLALAEELEHILKEKNTVPILICLEDIKLPLYTPASEVHGIPQDAYELEDQLKKSQGLIFIAPEYNGSIPPILINAIAWVSRTGNDDWRSSFIKKIAVVGTHSSGTGTKVCQAMRNQLEHLGAVVLPRIIATDGSKPLNSKSANSIFDQLISLSS